MNPTASVAAVSVGYPRYFKFGRHWVNSYKVFLCVGCEVGILTAALLAQWSGIPPLRVGLGFLFIALAGIFGARLQHLLVHRPDLLRKGAWHELWRPKGGGGSVFGGLLGVVPLSLVMAWWLGIPWAKLWDFIGGGILTGGFWIRLGCVFNGCCVGRETQSAFSACLHDTLGVRKRRIPVQFMEMAWWLLGAALFFWLWPRSFATGSYALGVLAWYGFGRFWLEPLREKPDLVGGKVRVNRWIAALLVLVGAGGLVVRTVLCAAQ